MCCTMAVRPCEWGHHVCKPSPLRTTKEEFYRKSTLTSGRTEAKSDIVCEVRIAETFCFTV